MTELSPAAQAVLSDVMYRMTAGESDSYARWIASAALRAAADQVAPKDVPEMHNCCHELLESVHEHINEIAAELEGKQ